MQQWNHLAGGMIGLLLFVLAVLVSPFKSKLRLEAENAVLRHQLNVLRRRLHGGARLMNSDRWFFIQLYRWFPSICWGGCRHRPAQLVHSQRSATRAGPETPRNHLKFESLPAPLGGTQRWSQNPAGLFRNPYFAAVFARSRHRGRVPPSPPAVTRIAENQRPF